MNTAGDTVLVMDDEPELLEWLAEYLESKNLQIRFAKNIGDAITSVGNNFYRFLVLDLNVPAPGEYKAALTDEGDLFLSYPGLYVAQFARNKGYRDRQVIVYSVHDIDEVRTVTERIRVTYVTKGRPRAFKSEIDDVLSYDPSQGGAGPTGRCS